MEGPVRFAAIIAALGPLGYGGGAEYGLDPVSIWKRGAGWAGCLRVT